MRITHVTTRILSTPADNPLVVGLPAPTDTREFVTAGARHRPGSDRASASRSSAARSRRRSRWRWTRSPGSPSARTHAGRGDRRQAAAAPPSSSGPGGIFTLALSAIDMACWDLKGKAVGQSVCALLGGLRDRAPTYASGALMRPHPVDYLGQGRARGSWSMGFRQMKMQCGSEPTVAASGRARARHARGDRPGRGPHVRHQPALEREPGHRGRPSHRAVSPLLARGPDGPRRLSRPRPASPTRCTTPIAAGEYHYGIVPFRHLLGAPLHRHRDDRPPARRAASRSG